MSTTVKLIDELTGEIIWLERDESDPLYCQGPVVTNSIDLGFPGPRTINNNYPEANGTTDLTQFHASRVISWNGWIKPTTDAPFPALTWDKIRKLCSPDRRPQMLVSENGWLAERRLMLRGDSVTSPLDRALGPVIVAAISWICPAGVFESARRNQTDVLVSGGSGGFCVNYGGICFDAGCGFNFGSGDFNGATIVANAGTVVTYPTITFTGPCTNPRVVNTNTQQGVYLNCILAPNQSVVVDCMGRTVTEIATPPITRLGYYDYTKSTWLTLPTGDNDFSYLSDDKRGVCRFNWRDRWI